MRETGPAPIDSLGVILSKLQETHQKPRHCTWEEERQFVAKVQTYTNGTPELVVREIDYGHGNDRVMQAYRKAVGVTESMQTIHLHGRRSVPDYSAADGDDDEPAAPVKRRPKPRDPDSLRASCRRSKSMCRRQVMQLAPQWLYTFTTRSVYPLTAMWRIWARFCRLVETADPSFRYVVVPQRHPDGLPDHWHLHAPCRTALNHHAMRRLWHISIAAEEGQRITRTLRGADAPGNVDDGRRRTKDGRIVSWGNDQHKRSKRMAGYVGRYIVKQFEDVEFNRKRYAVSKGIGLPPQVSFFLDALSFVDAVREACQLLRSTLPDGSPMLDAPHKPETANVVWALLPAHAPPLVTQNE